MAIKLTYDDLMADLERDIKERGLTFVTKDGTEVTLRPLMLLNDAEMRTVQVLMRALQDSKDSKDGDVDKQMEAIDQMLVAAADVKKPFKDSIADFPPQVRAKIFEAWLEADDELGEASSSES